MQGGGSLVSGIAGPIGAAFVRPAAAENAGRLALIGILLTFIVVMSARNSATYALHRADF